MDERAQKRYSAKAPELARLPAFLFPEQPALDRLEQKLPK